MLQNCDVIKTFTFIGVNAKSVKYSIKLYFYYKSHYAEYIKNRLSNSNKSQPIVYIFMFIDCKNLHSRTKLSGYSPKIRLVYSHMRMSSVLISMQLLRKLQLDPADYGNYSLYSVCPILYACKMLLLSRPCLYIQDGMCFETQVFMQQYISKYYSSLYLEPYITSSKNSAISHACMLGNK